MKQAEAAGKEDETEGGGDERNEKDIFRKPRPHLQHGVAGVHLFQVCFDGIRFPLHVLALREAEGEGRARPNIFLEPEHPVEYRLKQRHRLLGPATVPQGLAQADLDFLDDGHGMDGPLVVHPFARRDDTSRQGCGLMKAQEADRPIEQLAHLPVR